MEYEFSYLETIDIVYTDDFFPEEVPEQIRTENLLLYPLWNFDVVGKADVIDVFEQNVGTDKYFGSGFGNPQSEEEFDVFIEDIMEKCVEKTDFFYGIVDVKSGEFLGHATIEEIEWEKERCHIGIWLKESVWGNGISQERAEALLVVVFEELGLEIVEVLVVPENEKSIRAVEKYISEFNGSFDGVRRNVGVSPYGSVMDIAYYSISQEEFRSTVQ